MDIVDRLCGPHVNPLTSGDNFDEITRLQQLCWEAVDEIRRLRNLLKSARCPGGGWTGMPEGTDPTVDACLKAGACGCDLGDALRPDGQLTRDSNGQ